ncbi:nitroreductase/quinone reductase family protein [Nocardia sp. NPDC057440]|uniref:nitroreductase/quinone reductase family protein n=1 Tax=Nocardia sp. NPDC057440 TaxID=3346134 RepID=UPI00366B2310
MTDSQPTSAADFNAAIITEFRANAGKVGGMFAGAPLVLLTTIGAKSGRSHTTPLVYHRHDDHLLVFGSNGGSDSHPAWLSNVRNNPEVTVEIGASGAVETFQATAVVLSGAERDRRYAEQASRDPAFAAYQAGTERVIPVVALHKARRPSVGRRAIVLGAAILAGGAGVLATRGFTEKATPTTASATATARTTAIGDHLRQVHAQLRRDLGAVRAELAAQVGDSVTLPSLPRDLRAHCVGFCSALHEHHTSEDGVFPVLAKQFPELSPVLARLQREHGEVARVIAELQQVLDGGDTADPAHIRAEFDRLASELEAHFVYEESTIIDALNAMDTSALPSRPGTDRPGGR